MSINSSIEKFEELLDKRDNRLFEYLKHVLLLSSSLFAILAALHSGDTNSAGCKIAFLLAILLLPLCILSGLVALYVSVHGYSRLVSFQKEELKRQLRENDQQAKPIVFSPPRVFSICEKVCYISFALSILCLTFYMLSNLIF